jgi:hypothetical protein
MRNRATTQCFEIRELSLRTKKLALDFAEVPPFSFLASEFFSDP